MSEARYSLFVYDDQVIVCGCLTVLELQKIVNTYQVYGFTEVGTGQDNSTLVLMKPSKEKH